MTKKWEQNTKKTLSRKLSVSTSRCKDRIVMDCLASFRAWFEEIQKDTLPVWILTLFGIQERGSFFVLLSDPFWSVPSIHWCEDLCTTGCRKHWIEARLETVLRINPNWCKSDLRQCLYAPYASVCTLIENDSSVFVGGFLRGAYATRRMAPCEHNISDGMKPR